MLVVWPSKTKGRKIVSKQSVVAPSTPPCPQSARVSSVQDQNGRAPFLSTGVKKSKEIVCVRRPLYDRDFPHENGADDIILLQCVA